MDTYLCDSALFLRDAFNGIKCRRCCFSLVISLSFHYRSLGDAKHERPAKMLPKTMNASKLYNKGVNKDWPCCHHVRETIHNIHINKPNPFILRNDEQYDVHIVGTLVQFLYILKFINWVYFDGRTFFTIYI